MGGKMMHWMDVVSAISAQRHANRTVVTASVDNVSFEKPIALGNVITLNAKVTRAFKSSMEVYIEVWAEDIPNEKKFLSNTAFYTFVAVGKDGKPEAIPEIIPESDQEKKLYDGALRRRQLRLVLANRMDPQKATEIKSIFKLD